MKPYFDMLVVTPLEEEFQSAVEMFSFDEDLSSNDIIRFGVTPKTSKLRVMLAKQNAMGKTATQEAVIACLRDYEFGVITCAGIAGALSNDLNIGDVCYSGTIIDVLDNAKATEKNNHEQELVFSPTNYETPKELAIAISLDRVSPLTRPDFQSWQKSRGDTARSLVPGEFTGKNGKKETVCDPKVVDGAIACGSVSGSPKYNGKVKQIDRKVLAIETESGGLFSIAKQYGVPALTIRGISDYAGIDKNQFEEETHNQARSIAASNAFSFLSYQLGRAKIIQYFDRLRSERSGQKEILPLVEAETDLLFSKLLELEQKFHEKLRDLAPGFTLQAKGYKLPVPRVRIVDARSGMTGSRKSDPLEVRDTLRETRVLTLSIPKQYPDHSLPWVIANDLLQVQLDDRQVVPYVIDGNKIKSPYGSLLNLAGPDAAKLYGMAEVKIIFVIYDFKFEASKRVDFLHEQIEEWPNANFVLVTRGNENRITESKFNALTGSEVANICEISFVEIAHFLQKNFEMTGPASEVVASRLRKTFENFDLSAHPTYFAGLPKPVLDALLQANRRAELIELAVAGYLSFTVALDDQIVSLSRTTREKFLTKLAVSINVEKINFTEAELVAETDVFARENDFGISPSRFVSSFIERGILHVEGDKVRFSLQFMESYLLAKHMFGNPAVALKYFNVGQDGFDHPAFALYAEMGPSAEFIAELNNKLNRSIEDLSSRKNNDSIFTGEVLRPNLLVKQERLAALQKQLNKATEDVRADKDASHEKQKLLDATDRVRESAAKKQEDAVPSSDEERQEKQSTESRASATWNVAISLIGAGAERINADTKREFIAKIIQLSGLIIEDWTRMAAGIDFTELKADLLKQDDLVTSLVNDGPFKTSRDAERMLMSLVDLLEYSFLTQPFLQIAGVLCEEARDIVLAESISKITGKTDLEKMLQSMWMADIDPQRGRSLLLSSVKNYPEDKFIRVVLATHLIVRVYWNHWRKDDRLALLDVAQESLKVIGAAYNKSQIARMIDKEKGSADPFGIGEILQKS